MWTCDQPGSRKGDDDDDDDEDEEDAAAVLLILALFCVLCAWTHVTKDRTQVVSFDSKHLYLLTYWLFQFHFGTFLTVTLG